jgi:inner membrane protein
MAIEESNDSLYLRRASLPLGAQLSGFNPCGDSSNDWTTVATQSLAVLRDEMGSDCRVRAWLQFGRAPVIADGLIADARFGGTGRGNFTAMPVPPGTSSSVCPEHLTNWGMPRADVLAGVKPR